MSFIVCEPGVSGAGSWYRRLREMDKTLNAHLCKNIGAHSIKQRGNTA